jgi:hypothetical protein
VNEQQQIQRMRALLAWFIAQFQGESGAGETHWQTCPEYVEAELIVKFGDVESKLNTQQAGNNAPLFELYTAAQKMIADHDGWATRCTCPGCQPLRPIVEKIAARIGGAQ